MSTAADQFLTGSGVQSAKFKALGDYVVGTVSEEPEVTNQTDINTGEVKTWKDGSPRKQLVVTIQTSLREDADDDGRRRIYVKGKSLTDATRDAVKKVGARGLEVGGTLKIGYIGDGPPVGKGLDPAKLYAVEYTRPTSQAATDFLNGSQAQPAAQAPAQASPWG